MESNAFCGNSTNHPRPDQRSAQMHVVTCSNKRPVIWAFHNHHLWCSTGLRSSTSFILSSNRLDFVTFAAELWHRIVWVAVHRHRLCRRYSSVWSRYADMQRLANVLENIMQESAKHGLQISWSKTKIQNIGSGPPAATISVLDHQVNACLISLILAAHRLCRWISNRLPTPYGTGIKFYARPIEGLETETLES